MSDRPEPARALPPLPADVMSVPCAEICARGLLHSFRSAGVQVHLSVLAPPVFTSFTGLYTCTHHVNYYVEPTAAQHRYWQENQIP